MLEHNSPLLRERCLEYRHSSGLRILITPKPLRGAYAFFATKFGSMDRTYLSPTGETLPLPDGVAHFLEHKLFDAAPGYDPGARLSALGAESNAYTGYEKTVYFINATENFLPALRELLYFVTHPHFTEASVKKEQGIIAEEIRMYADNPWERCYQQMLLSLYHKNAVRREILGSTASLRRITPQLLRECYDCYYNPANMALTVCGDVDPDAVLAIVDELLPRDARPFSVVRSQEEEPTRVRRRTCRIRMQVAKPIFYIGIKDNRIPKDPEQILRRDVVMSLLDEVLFSTSGELYGSLLEESLVMPSFSAGYSISPRFAFHCIGGESAQPEEVLSRIRAYLRRVAREGISEQTLERSRRVLYADEIRGYDSTEEIATELLYSAFSETRLFRYPELLQSVSREELNAALEELILEDRFVLSVAEPMDGEIECSEKQNKEENK